MNKLPGSSFHHIQSSTHPFPKRHSRPDEVGTDKPGLASVMHAGQGESPRLKTCLCEGRAGKDRRKRGAALVWQLMVYYENLTSEAQLGWWQDEADPSAGRPVSKDDTERGRMDGGTGTSLSQERPNALHACSYQVCSRNQLAMGCRREVLFTSEGKCWLQSDRL